VTSCLSGIHIVQLGFDDIFFFYWKPDLSFFFINWNRPNLRISLEELHIPLHASELIKRKTHRMHQILMCNLYINYFNNFIDFR